MLDTDAKRRIGCGYGDFVAETVDDLVEELGKL
jgi:hypothetical protein